MQILHDVINNWTNKIQILPDALNNWPNYIKNLWMSGLLALIRTKLLLHCFAFYNCINFNGGSVIVK